MKSESIPTGVTARDGEMIYVGYEVESVQGTRFTVVHHEGSFYLQTKEGLWDLKPYMSPNLWITRRV
jgi:hypothetical protein